MATKNQIYKNKATGALVEALNTYAPGDSLTLLNENSTDAATEKHVPVVEKIEGGYRVTVGSVEHPMTEEHFIQWIELISDDEVQRRYLKPTDKPVAEFKTDATEVYAREYCNLHGLWKSK